jgi:hypothetical protein
MELPEMSGEMFSSPLDELVNAVDERTEAHPVAVAVHYLISFGNAVGNGPHFYVAETRHAVNEFALIVGPTSTARKGDARHLGLFALDVADSLWAADRIRSGLSSGEGVIYHVRNAVHGIDPKTGKQIVVDAGVTDKRLLILETEFSQPLKMFRRDGNVLSDVLRNAWDGAEVLSTLTRNNPIMATGSHVSVIGHI